MRISISPRKYLSLAVLPYLLPVLLAVFIHYPALAQTDQHNGPDQNLLYMQELIDHVLHKHTQSVDSIYSLSYRARDYLKSFGTTNFQTVRTFHVHAQRNWDSYYGWDFEITEVRDEGHFIMSHMYLPPDHYTRFHFTDNQGVLTQALHHDFISGEFPQGSHVNYIREIILPDPLIRGIAGTTYAKFPTDTVYQSDDSMILMSFSQPDSPGIRPFTTNIKLDTSLYLPVMFEDVLYDKALDLEQVLRVSLYDLKVNATLPDSALNPGYYFDRGYTLITREEIEENRRNSDQRQLESRRELTLQSLTALPLTNARGDTFFIELNQQGYTLIDFWFMSCLPCMWGFAMIDSLQKEGHLQNVKIIGVNGYDRNPEVIATMQNRIPAISFGHTERPRLQEWNITSYPTYLLIARDGKMVYRGSRLRAVLDKIMESEPDMESEQN